MQPVCDGGTRVNREIRRLRTELAELEERRAKLGSDLGE